MIRVRVGRDSLLRLAALAAGVIFIASPMVFAAGITLNWDPNLEPELSGYKVHYGTASRSYTAHIDVGNTVTSKVDNLAAGTTYYFSVTAYDSLGNESGYSDEIQAATPVVAVETISTPLSPSGPSSGLAGVAYTYNASGAASSSGDAVQYRFSWSDGSVSAWLPAGVTSASKSWSAPGTYTLVRVEARCALHTSVVSSPSPTLTVTISDAPQETVSAPSAPSGPTSGEVGTPYTYATGGSVSSAGHSVEYRFSWSDGSVSQWLPAGTASASKTWNAPGTYTLVRAEARCALHPTTLSTASPSIAVVISSGLAESVSEPSPPAGLTGGQAGDLLVFSTGGSQSSAGDPVVYRFHWGDGTTSEWVGPGQPVTAGKAWGTAGTYLVQSEAACAIHSAVGSFSVAAEVSIAEGPAPTDTHVLWTRGDTGKAALWKIDFNAMPGTIPVVSSAYLYSASGVGKPWQATSYAHVSATEGYVLWTRSDTGQGVLWKVDPGAAGVIPVTSSVHLHSASGVGKPWEATSYTHVSATEGYVLWTRSDTGQGVLWKVDPSAADVIPVTSSAYLYSPPGIGRPWQATSYAHVSAVEGYVLWTRSDTGQAALWKVNPSVSGVMPTTGSAYLHAVSGIGKPWQATSYVHVSATKGYVLWTRSDTGQGLLWEVNPSVADVIPITSSAYLHASSGVGRPWQATSFAR